MKVKLASFLRPAIVSLLALSFFSTWSQADVSKEIVTEYESQYVNRAMFLKTPIRGERQTIFIRSENIIPDSSSAGLPLSFLVGEQVRVTELRFRDNSIEFRVSSIDGTKRATLVFQFSGELEFGFPRRPSFDKALSQSLTAGLSYREIESAKKEYIQDEFRRAAQRMAQTTSMETSFVMDAVASEIPAVAASIRQGEAAEKELAELRNRVEEIQSERDRLSDQVSELRSTLNREQQQSAALRNERDSLARKESDQQSELQQLRQDNAQIRRELSSLASEMDIQLGSNTELTGQVDSLGQRLKDLRADWNALQQKIASTEKELEKIRDERNKLTSDLSLSQRKVAQLQSQLNSLTSNRDSLEARYIQTKNQLDNLEMSRKIATSLRLAKGPEGTGENGNTISYSVNLLSKRIGVLSVTPPENINAEGSASFSFASPDTVQFSEEERIMFASLGQELKIRAVWTAMGGSLESNLFGGEEIQAIAPRDTAEWTWSFTGSPDVPEPAILHISFLDQNDLPIKVTDLELEIGPESIIPLDLQGSFWIPALIGFILGSLLAAVLLRLTGKKNSAPPPKNRSRRDPSTYSTQKNL